MRLSRIAVCAILISTLPGCDLFGVEKIVWHQKLTLSVETPSGVKVASSVHLGRVGRQTWWRRQSGVGGGSGLAGEAVTLEVLPGRHLFALVPGTPLAINVFNQPLVDAVKAAEELRGRHLTKRLSVGEYPMLVTFMNISDPLTVTRVDPTKLESLFGSGVKLLAIEMTVTDEIITSGSLRSVIPWIQNYYDKKFDGNTIETTNSKNRLANMLDSGYFDTESYR